jgi:hypothetical protein
MFGVGPTYLFILRHRLPIGMMRGGWTPWLSTIGTNTAIAILVVVMIHLIGLGPFLLVHLPITVLGRRSAFGCSIYSTSSSTPPGPMTRPGVFTQPALLGSSY